MLHHFLDDKPWFRPKLIGLGAGLPIAWQGWLLLVTHMALVLGAALALAPAHPLVLIAVLSFIALAPLPIYRARTQGGWHWRWGPWGK